MRVKKVSSTTPKVNLQKNIDKLNRYNSGVTAKEAESILGHCKFFKECFNLGGPNYLKHQKSSLKNL